MQKKDLVSMFMESPFYFELTPRERLFLLTDHRRRFGGFGPAEPPYGSGEAALPPQAIPGEPEGETGQCEPSSRPSRP